MTENRNETVRAASMESDLFRLVDTTEAARAWIENHFANSEGDAADGQTDDGAANSPSGSAEAAAGVKSGEGATNERHRPAEASSGGNRAADGQAAASTANVPSGRDEAALPAAQTTEPSRPASAKPLPAPKKPLREGFTTGSCAAAAALACCLWQRDGECPERVELTVPEGRVYSPRIVAHGDGSCGVVKDSGDDPDITSGMEVVAMVELLDGDGPIRFRAGDGVGIITQPGLKLPAGEAAINPVPRRMIEDAVRSVFGARGAAVTVSIPGGRELAKKTFNPRLGIEGGLSVLGTSGVVRPMSEEALKDSLLVELQMRVRQGHRDLLFTFGNQGEEALKKLFPGGCIVQTSNYLGWMLDRAAELGVERLLIGGHPGKLAKVAAGVMQTHSAYADARREAIVTHLALMGAEHDLLQAVYESVTTEAAIGLIHAAGMDEVWNRMAQAAKRYCTLRVRGQIEIEIVFTGSAGEMLGGTVKP